MSIYLLIDIVMLLCVMSAVVVMALSNKLIEIITMQGIFSLLMALLYTALGAFDVSITEAAVGAGVSAIFFVNALRIIQSDIGVRRDTNNKLALTVIMILTISVLMTIYHKVIHDSNSIGILAVNNYVKNFYIAYVFDNFSISNVVTAILADFRGYDTMCETLVVITAALSTTMIMNSEYTDEES